MGEKDCITVYHWKYDDGSKGYAARLETSEEQKWLAFSDRSTKKKIRKKCEDLKDKYKPIPIKREKCRIPGGLDSVQASDFLRADRKKSEAGLAAMKALLCSCGTDLNAKKTLLELVSAILAGYCASSCYEFYRAERIPSKDMRVPVIAVKRADYAYFALEKIVRSLAVNTAVFGVEEYMFDETPLKAAYKPVLPHKTADRSIRDSAYLKRSKLRHQLFAQYRDTTLMVHCRFFPPSEIVEFQRKNPWVSLVLFGPSGKVILTSPIRINGAVLAKSDCSWDNKKLNYAVSRYVCYLSKKCKNKGWKKYIKHCFQSIEQMISNYNTPANSHPIRVSEKFSVSLQMLSLRLFLDSCRNDGGIDKAEADELIKDWYNTMLPGCCPAESSLDLDAEQELPPEPFQTQFESALCEIVQKEGYSHIYFIPEGNVCPLVDPKNNKLKYWGYIKWYQPKNKKQSKFLSLQFRRSTLDNLFTTYCPNYQGENWFKDVENLVSRVEYIRTTKARMYTTKEEKNSVDAVVIDLDRADFFPEEIQAALRKIARPLKSLCNRRKMTV